MTQPVLYVGNDNQVKLTGLYDENTSAYVNDATVTGQVYEADGSTAIGSSFTLTYVSASNGDYIGTAQDTLSLTAGQRVVVQVSASGNSLTGLWKVPCVVQERRAA